MPKRIAIIGGGISGLAAALRLGELAAGSECEVLLLEASPKLGGLVASERIGDCLIERGADSFITNKPGGVALCRKLGLESELIGTDDQNRRSLILARGKPIETPEGLNLIAPGAAWSILKTPILSWRGKLRCLLEPLVPRRETEGDESLASFTRRRLGQEFLDRIVQPMVGGIYTADPEKLSLAATLPRFLEMERRYGSLFEATQSGAGAAVSEKASGARYGLFASLRNGMSQLIDTLAERVRKVAKVETGAIVTAITALSHSPSGPPLPPWHGRPARESLGNRMGETPMPRTSTACPGEGLGVRAAPQENSRSSTGWKPIPRYEITWTDSSGQPHQTPVDAVILATPAYTAGDLCQSINPAAASELSAIEYASSAIVITNHALSGIGHPLNAFGLVIPAVEKRKILSVSFLNRKFPDRAPPGQVILRTFIGGALQPEMMNLSDGQLVETALAELRSIFDVRSEPRFAVVARYDRAMPQYHVGHMDRVARIEAALARTPAIRIAGNTLGGVGLPDSILSGENAAERIWAAVTG